MFTHSSIGCRIGLSSRYNQVNIVVYAGQSLCHGDNFVSSSHQKDSSQGQNKKISVRQKNRRNCYLTNPNQNKQMLVRL